MSTATATASRFGDAGSRIADQIRDGIMVGEFEPGTRIRQEEIASRFGASRVPVREALHQLENEGLVVVVPNAGAWVAEFTLADCEEIYLMREHLEPLLLGYSAPNLTDAQLDELADLASQMLELDPDDTDAFLRLDREFHMLSYAGAKTAQLGELISKLWNNTAAYRRTYVRRWAAESRDLANYEHQLIVSCLREGDVEQAGLIVASHIRRTRKQLASHPELFPKTARR